VVLGDPIAEYRRQMRVLASASPERRGRLTYLLAAESAGGLIAAEMTHAGVPWNVEIHDSLLSQALGPRPAFGMRPVKLERLAEQIRELLESPQLNPDSPRDLLRALNSTGLDVRSTAKWEIRDLRHPVVPVLLEYKKLHRMMTANGWTWMDEWIREGRFRPVYVPGGVITGRWGADGGGALQLPHFVRPAAIADPGWTFVIADAAQLEPRILAAMSGDLAMASAGRGHDMYQGIADAGVVESREHAKYGMLGAMYGGTTGVSAQVLPKFKIAFPRAMDLVEGAARAGEQGGTVHTWLGRTSLPGHFGSTVEGDDAEFSQDRRTRARSYGRFTRNFICQGTAAEWALLWMAGVRQRLRKMTLEMGLGVVDPETPGSIAEGDATAGPFRPDPVTVGPHLVFFLHDEILIHTPQDIAEQVAQAVHDAAREAGHTLFGQTDVEFPVSATISRTYANPKS
jgi:DNA polymerase-1